MKTFSRLSAFSLAIAAAGSLISAFGQAPRFLTPVSYAVPGASMVVVADVNVDGKLDLVTANGHIGAGSGVSLLLGNGDGTFQAAQTVVADGSPSWVVVADFNNDGKADIAVANSPDPNVFNPPISGPPANSVSILFGNGNGTFQAPTIVPTTGALQLAAADFNNDGLLDLAVRTSATTGVEVLLNQGSGLFTVSETGVIGFGGLIATDVNGDGRPDILTAGVELLGNGDGTFASPVALPVPGVLRWLAIGDFNGDGKADLATLNSGSRGSAIGELSLGNGIGAWAPPFITNFDGSVVIVAADFNGDGKDDLFSTGPGLNGTAQGGLYLSNGEASFTSFTHVAGSFGFIPGNPLFPAAADLDGNGSPDAVIANGSGILVALNTFGHPPLLAQITTSKAFTVGGSDSVTGTVTLGGPAPAEGALISLASSDPAAVLTTGNTVTVPAGAQSASFSITTAAVAAPTPVTISASYHATTLNTVLTLVKQAQLASLSMTPASLFGAFGGNPAVGTITLTGPAPDGTVVSLASSNFSALAVPATVAVPAGATTVAFAASAGNVKADTLVTVSGTLLGITRSGTLTVRQELATVTITKSQYTVKKSQLNVEATSTDRVGFLQLYNANTGALIGTVFNVGGGKFTGQYTVAGPLTSIAVQDSVGGVAIASVPQK